MSQSSFISEKCCRKSKELKPKQIKDKKDKANQIQLGNIQQTILMMIFLHYDYHFTFRNLRTLQINEISDPQENIVFSYDDAMKNVVSKYRKHNKGISYVNYTINWMINQLRLNEYVIRQSKSSSSEVKEENTVVNNLFEGINRIVSRQIMSI